MDGRGTARHTIGEAQSLISHSLSVEEALGLAKQGCVVDITAFPVEQGEDAWSAPEALTRYLESGLPPNRVTPGIARGNR